MDHGLDADLEGNVIADDSTINISDVIEVIQTTDPDFRQTTAGTGMYNGGGEVPARPSFAGNSRRQATVRIVEQPASKALRFRYECEGRSAGSIPGASSTPENKTFPAIQVVGYQGRAVVVVSCVTKDPPFRPHPHNLVGREGCRRGVCTLEINTDSMTVTFSNLGIQCVKKKDIEDALKTREEIRVDPFRSGFAHRSQPTTIDLNAVRLCFQVFLEGDTRGKFTVPLEPVVSDPIYDKKAMSDLTICKLSDCACTVAGGKEVILLCEKVAKEDIQVRFFEENNGAVAWEAFGDFQPSHVHKQVAISFRTPRYRTLEVADPVKVFIQLRRPSDGATSESLPFQFLPLDSDPVVLKRKRQKFGNDPTTHLRHLQEQDKNRNPIPQISVMNIPVEQSIKLEPRDASPAPFGGQMYGAGSSPRYVFPMDVAQRRTPSPGYNFPTTSYTPVGIPPISAIVPGNYVLPQHNWTAPNDLNSVAFGIAAVPPSDMDVVVANPTGLSSVLDLDSHELRQLNSEELAAGLDIIASNLPDNFSNNLSLSDIKDDKAQENMTDSFTTLTKAAIDDLCKLNSMYKPDMNQ